MKYPLEAKKMSGPTDLLALYDGDGEFVCESLSGQNARDLARATNFHARLVEALRPFAAWYGKNHPPDIVERIAPDFALLSDIASGSRFSEKMPTVGDCRRALALLHELESQT